MTTFTMPLHSVIKLTGGTADIVNGARLLVGGNIGLAHYPIFNPAYRDPLNGKIVDHFWNREIGVETIDMFQLAMRRKMNEIMPYYNKLYSSEAITFDPLSTIDLTVDGTNNGTVNATSNSDSTGVSTTDSESRAVQSETPQNMLAGNKDYATSGADSKGTTTADNTGHDTSTQDTTSDNTLNSVTKGYQGVASDLLMRYRASLMNIDMMIITDLEEMFMQVWDTGDSYTKGYAL